MTVRLKRSQNYAARVILRIKKSSNITIHPKSLHCLPVSVRSTYKIACLCYHCHSSTAPSYVIDMLLNKLSHTRSSSHAIYLLNRLTHHLDHLTITLCDYRCLLLLVSRTLIQMMSGVLYQYIIYVSFEEILVLFSLQRLRFLFLCA